MLPKLQQSSLAQSLKRDNPALLIQGKKMFIQLRINWRILLTGQIMNHTNHGRTSMLLKIHILHLEIFPKNTCQRRKYSRKEGNLIMSSLCLGHYRNQKNSKELEEEHLRLWRRNLILYHHLLKAERLRKERYLLQNSDDTMIELIYLSKSIIKVQLWN